MVLNKLKNILPLKKSYSITFKKIIEYVSKKNNFSQSEVDKICKAYDISKEAHEGQLRRSGEPYFNHCIYVAYNLAKWNMYAVALQDLTFFTFSYLKANFNYSEIKDKKKKKKQVF